MTKISSKLKFIVAVLRIATNKEQIPEMFRILADFLKNEPDENFNHSSYEDLEHIVHTPSKEKINLPLTLNESAMKTLETRLSKFPDIIQSGKIKKTELNFIYMIGQLLTRIAFVFDTHSQVKGIVPHIDEFFKIWGSYDQMNASSLANKYRNKETTYAKHDLISKLEKSADLVDTKILPFIISEKR